MEPPTKFKWHRPTREKIDRVMKGRAAKNFALRQMDAHLTIDSKGRRIFTPDLELLFKVGVPLPDKVTSAIEYAIALLKLAAEIEHALMVQYLYAADSLDASEDDSQENFTVKVMRVAIQEMGHLASVQNILILTGGPSAIHMQRDTFRAFSELNPIPFVLEKVNLSAIAKFVAAEMPAVIPSSKIDRVAQLLKIAKDDVGAEPHRVGAIYAVLRWIFLPKEEANDWLDMTELTGIPSDFHVSDTDLSSNDVMDAFEARVDEWQVGLPDFILATPRSCAEIVDAIDRISEQGEGWGPAEDSHFAEFLELADAFDAGLLNKSIIDIPKSPTLEMGKGGENGVLISHPYSKFWGEVFSLQYGLLTLSIYHALVTRRNSDGTIGMRESLSNLAMRAMRRVIGPVASILTKLPLAEGDQQLCGPPYDLNPCLLQAGTADELKGRHLSTLERLESIYSAIEASPDFSTQNGHDIAIANLRNFDQLRRDLFS